MQVEAALLPPPTKRGAMSPSIPSLIPSYPAGLPVKRCSYSLVPPSPVVSVLTVLPFEQLDK